jgi:hypothetical protein
MALKMTQADASALCNVGIRFLSELENGKPTLQILFANKFILNSCQLAHGFYVLFPGVN